MSKNSTLKLWDLLSKEEYSAFDLSVHKILSLTDLEPKQEIVNNIFAYACSVRQIKIKSKDNILIFLN
jgi:hypothetical protein